MTPLVLLLALAAAADFKIAPGPDRRISLTVEKTGLMRGKKHLFVFERYQGTLRYDAARPQDAKVEIEIESAGAVLKDEWVSPKDHKKIQDYALNEMLDVANHSKIKFSSTRVDPLGQGRFKIFGTLTIRGIAKPAEVSVAMEERPGGALRFEGTSTIRMTGYGLKPPTAALGTIGTKDLMTVSFQITATQ